MTSNNNLPIYHINKYIWDLAKGDVDGEDYSSTWDTSSYTYQPFFPVNESLAAGTELTPFVLYDFLYTPPSNTQWFIDCEKAVYTIIGEVPKVYEVRDFIYRALKKFDTSAQEINSHINDSEIRFKFIKCEMSNFMMDEKRIDSFKPKFVTSLILSYDYTKS
jgi:hypothetical protein